VAEPVTLADLLPEKLDSVADQVRDRMCDDEQIGGMKLAWDYVGKELHKALASVLDATCSKSSARYGRSWARSPPSPIRPSIRPANGRSSSSASTR
jgi:hypothetical protein